MVLIQVLNDKLEEFWKVVNTGFILDGEQKESIKQHFLASKSVPSDFWSSVLRLSGSKSSGIPTDEDFRSELWSMVEEIVKGGQPHSNLEASTPASSRRRYRLARQREQN